MDKPFMNTIDRLPLRIVEGDGVWLVDDYGNRYIDLWGDEGVASLGYGVRSVFFDALRDFATTESLQRLPEAYDNPLRVSAAAALAGHAKYDRVFFCNSGAEANEAAIKLARRYWSKVEKQPKRHWVLTVKGNFHGRTGFALAASDSSESLYHKQGYGPIASGFGVIDDSLDIESVKTWDAFDMAGEVCADGNYTMCSFEEAGWSQVAAVTMAPILGNNVVRTYPKWFWERLDALRRKHGFLIIFDEVQVGMGRTGYFNCHHHPELTNGVRPDIVCMGKGIAGGLPLAAILADDKVAEAFRPGVHFSTFGGTLVCLYMMREVIYWLDANMESIQAKGRQIRAAFSAMVKEGLLQTFDGAGIHYGFTPSWGDGHGFGFCDEARKHGILLVTHRPHGPIRFTPPLTITPNELATALDAVMATAATFNK